MNEDQERIVAGGRYAIESGAAALEFPQSIRAQLIDTGLDPSVEALDEFRRGQRRRRTSDDVQGRKHDVTQRAARGAPALSSLFQATPAQACDDLNIPVRAAAARGRQLRAQQVARVFGVEHQFGSAGDLQNDEVFARHGDDANSACALSLSRDLHRLFHPPELEVGGQRRRGYPPAVADSRRFVAGHDESDGLTGRRAHTPTPVFRSCSSDSTG